MENGNSISLADRWERDLPVNFQQLAAVQGVSYATVKRWGAAKNFPRVGNLIRPSSFLDWWKKEECRRIRARHPRPAECKSGAPSRTSGSPSALPQRAARLLDEAESHMSPASNGSTHF